MRRRPLTRERVGLFTAQDEPWRSLGARLKRRLVSIPLYWMLWALVMSLLPVLVVVGLLVGVIRRRRFALVRMVLFFVLFLNCEVFGMMMSLVGFVLSPLLTQEKFLAFHYRLQNAWAGSLLWGAARLFSVRFEVEGQEATEGGPYLFLVRHASMADTVLASGFVTSVYEMRLRYVLKRELLWDPCLDIVGLRIPNAFVLRGSGDSAKEIARVQALSRGMGSKDGVLIYPEGTRFTRKKRARILEKLAEKEDALLPYAQSLECSLPPKVAGVLAMLQENPGIDVVFCVHAGFERMTSFWEVWRGGVIGNVVHVGFWRVKGEEIPETQEGQEAWLLEEWRKVDAWVKSKHEVVQKQNEAGE